MLHKETVDFSYSSAGCMEGFYEDGVAKWTGSSGTVKMAAAASSRTHLLVGLGLFKF